MNYNTVSELAFSAKPNPSTDRIMKIRIFDQLDSRTSGCFETHLIILAVVAFGLTDNLNYDFNLGSGGEYILSYRPAALNTLNKLST